MNDDGDYKCPSCGSTNVKWFDDGDDDEYQYWDIACRDCGEWDSLMVPLVDDESTAGDEK